jgi:protein TonB
VIDLFDDRDRIGGGAAPGSGMHEMRLPLCLSAVFHAGVTAVLAALVLAVPTRPQLPREPPAVQVSLVSEVPQPPAPPTAELPALPPAPAPEPPRAIAALPVERPVPPPAPVAEPRPLPPIPGPAAKPRPPPRPRPARVAPIPERPAPAEAPRAATAALPAPAPPPAPAAPIVSAAYRGMLGAWFERHKRYPESARERGEEGRAVLRFRVARDGRVLDYAIVQRTGHPDLDAALDEMMQGATLPPFPPDMTAAEIEVTLTIRFGLRR